MNRFKNPRLKPFAQKLRRRMTEEERHLWFDFLRTLPISFHRQKVIGSYIVDFYCAGAHLVIELDGAQHFEEEGKAKDRERDAFLSELGLRILRYSNVEINRNFRGVCEDILKHLSLNDARSEPSP